MDYLKHNPLRVAGTAALSVVLAVGLMVPAIPDQAYATPTSAQKQAEAQAVLQSLEAMQEELDAASDNYFTALDEQEQAKQKMDEAQQRIDEASDEIAELQVRLGDRAKSMYRNGSATLLDVLLGSASFSEFVNNWNLLDKMNQSDTELVDETKTLRQQIEDEKAVYAEQEQVAAQKAEEAKRIQEEAQATVNDMQATYDSLSAEAAELLAQEQAAQEAAELAAAQAALEQQQNNNNGNNGGNNGDSSRPSGNSSSKPPAYNANTGNAVVDRGLAEVGVARYVWAACSPHTFDCSGFVSYCLTGRYNRLGTTKTFIKWPQVSNPQPGDVCVNSGHCGIYIGGGQMVHASGTKSGIKVSAVKSNMIYVRWPG